MSYLLDKKIKRKKSLNIALAVVLFVILFYFRSGIFDGFSSATQAIFRPVLILGSGIGGNLGDIVSYFISKESIYNDNQTLKIQISAEEARMANYDSIVKENESLKEILGRKKEKVTMVLSAILAKPNQSAYDTLLIDAGINEGIKIGDTVFAKGDVPIGRVDIVYGNSSKVVLFSSAEEKTQASIAGKPDRAGGDTFMELVGRGGGNFEMILPRDFILQKGDQVVLPGINSYLLAVAETVISDPREPFIKALLRSPVNVQELKFVQIEIQK
ncbi:MAG: rod shape-determining protein MreC [Candidatus Paceibacterota bacterium]|jgi:cell shape-determining protein MreC